MIAHPRQWCEPPCVLPYGHSMDCWYGDSVVDQVSAADRPEDDD